MAGDILVVDDEADIREIVAGILDELAVGDAQEHWHAERRHPDRSGARGQSQNYRNRASTLRSTLQV